MREDTVRTILVTPGGLKTVIIPTDERSGVPLTMKRHYQTENVMFNIIDECSLPVSENVCVEIPRKRQRLNHLSPDEKLARRKLKNRVAAQTARDRKKARMDELEIIVVDLEKKNERLEEENERLKAQIARLTSGQVKRDTSESAAKDCGSLHPVSSNPHGVPIPHTSAAPVAHFTQTVLKQEEDVSAECFRLESPERTPSPPALVGQAPARLESDRLVTEPELALPRLDSVVSTTASSIGSMFVEALATDDIIDDSLCDDASTSANTFSSSLSIDLDFVNQFLKDTDFSEMMSSPCPSANSDSGVSDMSSDRAIADVDVKRDVEDDLGFLNEIFPSFIDPL